MEIIKEGVKMDNGPHQLHIGPDKRFPRCNKQDQRGANPLCHSQHSRREVGLRRRLTWMLD